MNIKPILLTSALTLTPLTSYADHHGTKPDLCFTEDEFKSLAVDFEKDNHRRYKGKTIETHRYSEVDEYVEIYQPDPQEVCIWDTNSDLFKSEVPFILSVSDGGIFDLDEEQRIVSNSCIDYRNKQLYIKVIMILAEDSYHEEVALELVDDFLEEIALDYRDCKHLSEELGLPEPIYHQHLRDVDYNHPTLNFDGTNQ